MADSGTRKEGGGSGADIVAVLQDAQAHHQAGRLDEAEQAYRQALSQDPKALVAHVNLGVVLHDLGRAEEAAESFHKALAIDSLVAEVHYGLGSL